MLKGISPLFSPELLAVVYRMGHGDELVLADAHFPGDSINQRVIRADGISVLSLLDAILPLYEIDSYVPDPVVMMSPVEGDTADPIVGTEYAGSIAHHCPGFSGIQTLNRFQFYERARSAFAVVMTGDVRKYGNIILKKGVTPVQGGHTKQG